MALIICCYIQLACPHICALAALIEEVLGVQVPVEQVVLLVGIGFPPEVRAAHPGIGGVANVECPVQA